ncbi:Protein of unknown function [Gryllus bimaculatus]|nr:Protein of unknown function [Gryllus bimaculatus]
MDEHHVTAHGPMEPIDPCHCSVDEYHVEYHGTMNPMSLRHGRTSCHSYGPMEPIDLRRCGIGRVSGRVSWTSTMDPYHCVAVPSPGGFGALRGGRRLEEVRVKA